MIFPSLSHISAPICFTNPLHYDKIFNIFFTDEIYLFLHFVLEVKL